MPSQQLLDDGLLAPGQLVTALHVSRPTNGWRPGGLVAVSMCHDSNPSINTSTFYVIASAATASLLVGVFSSSWRPASTCCWAYWRVSSQRAASIL